jgi:hypothetical protein
VRDTESPLLVVMRKEGGGNEGGAAFGVHGCRNLTKLGAVCRVSTQYNNKYLGGPLCTLALKYIII